MKERLIPILISLLLLAGLIYFSDFQKIVTVISQANPYFIIFAFFLWPLGAFIRSARWQYLLQKISIKVPFFQTMKIYITGLFLSNLTPAKIGEPIRSVLLKKSQGKGIGKSLPTIFLERIFDLIVMMLISILGGLFLVVKLSKIFSWLILVILFYVFLIFFGIFILTSKKRIKKTLLKFCTFFSIFPWMKKLGNRLDKFSTSLYESFSKIKAKKTLLVTFLFTLPIWLLEGAIFYIIFLSLGLKITLLSAVVIVPIAALIGVLTFLPGGLGSSEIIMVLFFTTLFSLTLPQVTAAVLLVRLVSFWTYAIVGSIILSTLKYRYKV